MDEVLAGVAGGMHIRVGPGGDKNTKLSKCFLLGLLLAGVAGSRGKYSSRP